MGQERCALKSRPNFAVDQRLPLGQPVVEFRAGVMIVRRRGELMPVCGM